MELGVEGVSVGLGQLPEDLGEDGVVVDPAVRLRVEVVAYGSIPVAMGSPASTQAVVPPATFTASMPLAR